MSEKIKVFTYNNKARHICQIAGALAIYCKMAASFYSRPEVYKAFTLPLRRPIEFTGQKLNDEFLRFYGADLFSAPSVAAFAFVLMMGMDRRCERPQNEIDYRINSAGIGMFFMLCAYEYSQKFDKKAVYDPKDMVAYAVGTLAFFAIMYNKRLPEKITAAIRCVTRNMTKQHLTDLIVKISCTSHKIISRREP